MRLWGIELFRLRVSGFGVDNLMLVLHMRGKWGCSRLAHAGLQGLV